MMMMMMMMMMMIATIRTVDTDIVVLAASCWRLCEVIDFISVNQCYANKCHFCTFCTKCVNTVSILVLLMLRLSAASHFKFIWYRDWPD